MQSLVSRTPYTRAFVDVVVGALEICGSRIADGAKRTRLSRVTTSFPGSAPAAKSPPIVPACDQQKDIHVQRELPNVFACCCSTAPWEFP